jgi:hypothetical protein
MSVESSISLLRANDPAKRLVPLAQEAQERLRAEIVRAPVRRRPTSRRLLVALAAGVAALLFAATGWAVYQSVFQGAAEVRDDFATWTQRLELPPGAAWRQPNLDGEALYGGRAAQMIALSQATCAWLSYWDGGYKAQAAARMRAAVAGFAQVRAAMPVHPDGANEEAGGYAPQALAFYDRLIEQERRNVPELTEQYLVANCR